jgi:hypothetical protein
MPPRLNKFPEGTKFGEWHISQEDWGTGIRRHYTMPDGKRHKQRYPLSKYKHLLGNEAELARFVVRLNGDDPFKRRAREVTELRQWTSRSTSPTSTGKSLTPLWTQECRKVPLCSAFAVTMASGVTKASALRRKQCAMTVVSQQLVGYEREKLPKLRLSLSFWFARKSFQ